MDHATPHLLRRLAATAAVLGSLWVHTLCLASLNSDHVSGAAGQDFHSLYNQAASAFEMQRYHEAAVTYELALAALDPAAAQYELSRLATLFHLTYAYLGEEEGTKARKTAEEYLNGYQLDGVSGEQNAAKMHNVLAALDINDHDTQGAIGHMVALTAIYEKAYPGSTDLARAYLDLGTLYNNAQQEGRAEDAYKAALALYKNTAAPDPALISELELHVARMLYKQGKYQEARTSYTDVHELLTRTERTDRGDMLDNAALYGLALIATEEGRYQEADELYTVLKQDLARGGHAHPMYPTLVRESEQIKARLKAQQ